MTGLRSCMEVSLSLGKAPLLGDSDLEIPNSQIMALLLSEQTAPINLPPIPPPYYAKVGRKYRDAKKKNGN
jgi:hypothetical protein